ncbi:MAG: hypothetical protein J6U54_12780 [Clostridiales bacterium]|nr:hypothetical protein [Clostridiales bacterium]
MERRKYGELQMLDDYSFIAKEAGLMDKSMIIMENYALKGYHDRGDVESKEFEKDIVAIRRVRKLMYSYVDSYDMMTEETGE